MAQTNLFSLQIHRSLGNVREQLGSGVKRIGGTGCEGGEGRGEKEREGEVEDRAG